MSQEPAIRFLRLVNEVGKWSYENFGSQQSKTTFCRLSNDSPGYTNLLLGPVAPAFGIIEEMGELFDALAKYDRGLVEDSIADAMIYIADYAARSQFDVLRIIDWDDVSAKLDIETIHPLPEKTREFLLRRIGAFCHVNLKRHQGIRGFDDPEVFINHIRPLLCDFIVIMGRCLSIIKEHYAGKADAGNKTTVNEILDITQKVWVTVQKRNWKKDKVHG